MFTVEFWKDTAERAIATFAQTLIALITVVAGADLAGISGINWQTVLVTSAIAAGLAVLKAIVASKFGTDGPTPSFVEYEYPHVSQPTENGQLPEAE